MNIKKLLLTSVVGLMTMLPNAWGEARNSSDWGTSCANYLEKAERAVEDFLKFGVIEFATEIPDACSDYGLASVKYMIDYAKGSETCEQPEAIDVSNDGTDLFKQFKGIAFVAKYKSDVVKKAKDVCAAYQFKGVLDVYLAGNTETALEQFAALKVPDQTTKPEAYYYYMLAKGATEDDLKTVLSQITNNPNDAKYYSQLALLVKKQEEQAALLVKKQEEQAALTAAVEAAKAVNLSGESVQKAAYANQKIYNSGFVFMALERDLDKGRTLTSLAQACLDYTEYDASIATGDCVNFIRDVMDAQ